MIFVFWLLDNEGGDVEDDEGGDGEVCTYINTSPNRHITKTSQCCDLRVFTYRPPIDAQTHLFTCVSVIINIITSVSFTEARKQTHQRRRLHPTKEQVAVFILLKLSYMCTCLFIVLCIQKNISLWLKEERPRVGYIHIKRGWSSKHESRLDRIILAAKDNWLSCDQKASIMEESS